MNTVIDRSPIPTKFHRPPFSHGMVGFFKNSPELRDPILKAAGSTFEIFSSDAPLATASRCVFGGQGELSDVDLVTNFGGCGLMAFSGLGLFAGLVSRELGLFVWDLVHGGVRSLSL
ncbi:uncharacterized protein LOC111277658 [Durio zibethinus]|uniref:Uncharacterized protein LOC111277658 n=1 Tax=Durio zibethinus TaxID=66656 RepID=A0A6P5WUK4_DURZI|nr:uncharacterized protein LOC111277658 [Durio zibethinus]